MIWHSDGTANITVTVSMFAESIVVHMYTCSCVVGNLAACS